MQAAAFGQRVILQQLLRTGRVPVDAKTGPVLAPPHYEAVSLHQTPLQVRRGRGGHHSIVSQPVMIPPLPRQTFPPLDSKADDNMALTPRGQPA